MTSGVETEDVAAVMSPAQEGDEHLGPGTEVGAFAVDRILGSGGFGTVYAAHHRVIGKRAAVKVLRHDLASDRECVARFIREAQLVNAVGHPNVVDIFELGCLPDGRPYLAMELIEGSSLAVRVRLRGPLGLDESRALVGQLAAALDAVHAAGIVHRDLKPPNVLLTEGGEGLRAKLIDFGVGKLLRDQDEGLTTVGRSMGSPVSMSPEQIRGEVVDARADVYGLGVTLFFAVAGRYPFQSDDPNELRDLHLSATPPSLLSFANVPRAWDDVVARALAKDRTRRFASAGELAHALDVTTSATRTAWTDPLEIDFGDAADDDAAVAREEAIEAASDLLVQQGFLVALRTGRGLVAVASGGAAHGGDAETRVRSLLAGAGLLGGLTIRPRR